MTQFLTLITVVLCSSLSFAAVPAKNKVRPSRILQNEGVVSGGVAGTGFSIIDIRRTADKKKKVERIVVDVGDINGARLKGQPGYFYAELKQNPQRLVLDFSQMPKTSVDENKLRRIMKNSLAVKGTRMSLDPVDSSLNLSFALKPKTKAKIYPMVSKKSTSKVVIDLITE